jgi:hypothetical protein
LSALALVVSASRDSYDRQVKAVAAMYNGEEKYKRLHAMLKMHIVDGATCVATRRLEFVVHCDADIPRLKPVVFHWIT